jgi:beta-lactamase class A
VAQRTGESLESRLKELAAPFSGTVGMWAKHLGSGETVCMNPDETFETASTIKVLIMVEAFHQIQQGRLSLGEPMTFTADHYVMGSGVLRDLTVGLTLSVRDVITLMIVVSDNVATNMMIDRLGRDQINRAAQRLGMSRTRLLAKLDFESDANNDGFGVSTPRDLGLLMERLYRGTAVSADADRRMTEILLRQQYNTVLTRELPYPLLVPAHTRAERPVVQIASKSGSWEGVRNDVGIVYTPRADYVVSVFSKGCTDLRFHVDNEAMRLLPKLTRAVFDHFYGPA